MGLIRLGKGVFPNSCPWKLSSERNQTNSFVRECQYSNGFITTIPGIPVKSFLSSVTMLVIPFSFMVSEMRISKNGDLSD